MSWDILAQDLPEGIATVKDIPDDFRPRPLPVSRAEVIAAVLAVAPFADCTSEANFLSLDAPGVSLTVSVGPEEPLECIAFCVSGGEHSAGIVAAVLERLGLRAIDGAADGGIFSPERAAESMARWWSYRERVFSTSGSRPA